MANGYTINWVSKNKINFKISFTNTSSATSSTTFSYATVWVREHKIILDDPDSEPVTNEYTIYNISNNIEYELKEHTLYTFRVRITYIYSYLVIPPEDDPQAPYWVSYTLSTLYDSSYILTPWNVTNKSQINITADEWNQILKGIKWERTTIDYPLVEKGKEITASAFNNLAKGLSRLVQNNTSLAFEVTTNDVIKASYFNANTESGHLTKNMPINNNLPAILTHSWS